MRITRLNFVKTYILLAGLMTFVFGMAPPSNAADNALNLSPAPYKPLVVGTKFFWKKSTDDDTREQIITAVNRFKVDFTWDGKEYSQYPVCLWCLSRGAESNEKTYATLWPLTVGKSVSVDRISGRGSWTNKITVTGTEKVTVSFGTVDAYRVVNESISHNSDWEGVRVYWYAPSLGWTVKSKHSDNRGNNYTWELTGVTKPEPSRGEANACF